MEKKLKQLKAKTPDEKKPAKVEKEDDEEADEEKK